MSFALILIVGLALGAFCGLIKLPKIIGMLAAGIILGPYVLNVIDPSVLSASADLRKAALVIILLKAGLSLDINDLKKVGRPAVMLSFVPASFEIIGYVLLAPLILGITRTEAAVMGAVLAAVSPAVVVPRMVKLIEEKRGTDKAIPQMIMAGASCDDIFVIVLFSTFLSMAQGGNSGGVDAAAFINIPVSIILGIAVGAVSGLVLHLFFEKAFSMGHGIRNSTKTVIVLAAAFFLTAAESFCGKISFSGLLAVVSMACVLRMKSVPEVSGALSAKFGKIWIAAEVMLFVLVGAVIMIFAALIFRSIGVVICTAGTSLTLKERIFCVAAYLPKATVQAAIGSVPLAAGLACGNIVLSVAVMAIRTCLHKHMRTSFRQILPQTALKILAGRQPACGFLPCLQQNYARKSAHISYEDRF